MIAMEFHKNRNSPGFSLAAHFNRQRNGKQALVADKWGFVLTGRQGMGMFFLGHASRPSMARSGAGYPAGSRPQKKHTHTLSHSGHSANNCGFDFGGRN